MAEHKALASELEQCVGALHETFNIMTSVIPAIDLVLNTLHFYIDGSGSTDNLLSLSSCLEAVNSTDLSKATLILSAFSDRVDSLGKIQGSKFNGSGSQELLNDAASIPDSPMRKGDSEQSLQKNEDSLALLQYQYRKLEAGEIRILELFPGARSDPLCCKLIHIPVREALNFEAVSYTWGTEEPTSPIQIDGGRFFVRPNLEAALIELRTGCEDANVISEPEGSQRLSDIQVDDSDNSSYATETSDPSSSNQTSKLQYDSGVKNGPRRLWIDAICIDQGNLHERSQQVRLMSRIYSRSQRLLIWLGVESQDSNLAMDFLSHTGRKMLAEGLPPVLELLGGITSLSLAEIRQSVINLLARPWFTRAWVLQEYVLGGADDTLFMCGSKTLSNESFMALHKYQSSLDLRTPSDDPYVQVVLGKYFLTGIDRLLEFDNALLNHYFHTRGANLQR
jgi:hypothetical protein